MREIPKWSRLVSWPVGVFLSLIGLSGMSNPTSEGDLIMGLAFLVIGLGLIPPLRVALARKTGIELPAWVRVMAALVLLGIGSSFLADEGEVSRRELSSIEQEEESLNGLTATESDAPADLVESASLADAPCTPTELSAAAVELVRLYEELHAFKDDTEFLDMGFSQAGPYYAWMEAVQAHTDQTGLELLHELGFLPGEVLALGMTYTDEDPNASTLSAIEFYETKIRAGLALTRCDEQGTAVQDIARTSAEARRAYVQPLARPPAGADDVDEWIVNPCIAAVVARNPELDGFTPWEIRNTYPEIWGPLVALMREQAAPVLAEFGDNARARSIVLDRLRDDCIRGTRGEEPLDWSEAEVRDLLSISQDEATDHEIPMRGVSGEPYFPGEVCESPWVKFTPITADTTVGRHLSDTGWLCEASESARFCHTVGGQQGWEQGFFGCSSSERSNAYWLGEWERSQQPRR